MFCFRILRIFGGNCKKRKTGKSWHFRAPTPSIGNPRRGIDLRQGVGYPRRSEAKVPKWHPLGHRGIATVHREQIFRFLFPNTSYSYTDSLRTLINN